LARHHGPSAGPDTDPVDEALFGAAAGARAAMIVMGAYTHSRVRESSWAG
jgi:hypothetical protein